MIRKYKKTLIISSLLILLPTVIGLLLRNQRPRKRAKQHAAQQNHPKGHRAQKGKYLFQRFILPYIQIAILHPIIQKDARIVNRPSS